MDDDSLLRLPEPVPRGPRNGPGDGDGEGTNAGPNSPTAPLQVGRRGYESHVLNSTGFHRGQGYDLRIHGPARGTRMERTMRDDPEGEEPGTKAVPGRVAP